MKRIVFALLTLTLAPALLADGSDVVSCNDVHVQFSGREAVRAEQQLPVANVRSLRIASESHAAVRVIGWDEPRYAATVCKTAENAATLSKIDARLNGDEITASGPEGERWQVTFIVRTPRRASLTIDTKNGPVSMTRVDGAVTVRAKNGPISVHDSSGTIDATTVNGPISFSGGSGEVKLATTNGPVTLKLSGQRWEGHLSASTTNGPVSVKVPRGFASTVAASVDGRGPISCHGDFCGDTGRIPRLPEDDKPRRLTFGSGAANVSVATHNGPLSVAEAP